MKVRGGSSLFPPWVLSLLPAGPSHMPRLYHFNTCFDLTWPVSGVAPASKWHAKSCSPPQLESGLALIPNSCCLAQQCCRLGSGSGSCRIHCLAYYQSLAAGLSCQGLRGAVASVWSAYGYQRRRDVDSCPETPKTVVTVTPY